MLPPSYVMRPTKVKQIAKPLGVGINGEKINLTGNYKNSLISNSTALSNVINLENQRSNMNSNNSIGKITQQQQPLSNYSPTAHTDNSQNLNYSASGGQTSTGNHVSDIKKIIRKRQKANMN
jgi:hypothetical protein